MDKIPNNGHVSDRVTGEMTTGSLSSPRHIEGGIALRVIALQYGLDSPIRSLQVRAVNVTGGCLSEALRLERPPVETLKRPSLSAGQPAAATSSRRNVALSRAFVAANIPQRTES